MDSFQLLIDFPSWASRRRFIEWLDNQGEQDLEIWECHNARTDNEPEMELNYSRARGADPVIVVDL